MQTWPSVLPCLSGEGRCPFERLLSQEDVPSAVNFLLSENAGVMMGSVITFDRSGTGGNLFALTTPAAQVSL
jgi:hypothetical protein